MKNRNKKAPKTNSISNKGALCSGTNKDSKFLSTNELENDFNKLVYNKSNVFPVEILHDIVQEIIYEASEKLQFNIDFLGAGILSAFSAAIGNLYQIKMQPTWIVKANLFMIIVGRTGDSKSPALNFCYKPIRTFDEKQFETYEDSKKEFNKSDNSAIKPQLKKRLLVDFTPEALIKVHENNEQGITIYSDEILSWLNNIGRYSKSGELQTYLSLWNGEPIATDRVNSEPILLKDTFLNIVGSIQTTLVKELTKGDKSLNGFCDRLLFVYPDCFKPIKWSDKTLSTRVVENYSKLIEAILANEFTEPQIIEFSKEGRKTLISWQNELKEIEFLFEYERQISVKLENYTLRFCIILEVIECLCKQIEVYEISKKTVLNAIKLYHYFYNNAIKIKEDIYSKSYFDSLTNLQKEIYKELDVEFTTHEGFKIACKEIHNKPRTSKRSFQRFLKDKKLFEKLNHGKYKKLISI